MDERLERFLRTNLRKAGRKFQEARRSTDDQLAEAKVSYRNARDTALADLPRDEKGRAKIVCRRHAERRAAAIDAEGHPACFDADHPDCRGCAEDIRERTVETW